VIYYEKAWPERVREADQWSVANDAVVRKLMSIFTPPRVSKDGGLSWPGVMRILEDCPDRQLPFNVDQFVRQSTWLREYIEFLTACLEQGKTTMATPERTFLGRFFAAHACHVLQVARWWHAGKRYYFIDDETAAAILNTEFTDFPVALLRAPLPSFWVAMPPGSQWHVTTATKNEIGKAGLVRIDAPELQRIYGAAVSAQCAPGDDDGVIDHLHITLVGKGRARPQRASVAIFPSNLGDCVIDFTVPLHDHTTLAVYSTPSLARDKPGLYTMIDGVDAEELETTATITKLILGLMLYLTSVHPQLTVKHALPRPKGNERKHKNAKPWRHYREATRSAVVYVGGPDQGHQREHTQASRGLPSKRKPPTPHVRSGHFRHQHVGKERSRVEIRWIQPMQIGSWDRRMAWEATKGTIVRRTREATEAENRSAQDLMRGVVQ